MEKIKKFNYDDVKDIVIAKKQIHLGDEININGFVGVVDRIEKWDGVIYRIDILVDLKKYEK